MARLLARVLRRVLGGPRRQAPEPLPEVASVLDGASTALGVATVAGEAIVVERGTSLGQRLAVHPELIQGRNALAQPLEIELAHAEGAAVAMAAAYAAAGLRAVAVVDSDSLEEGAADLERAVMRHLPLVVLAEIGARPQPDEVTGGGHEAYHALAELGCGLAFASDLQELSDLTLLAHHVAELSLVPHVVAYDRRECALGLEGVALPSAALAERFLGRDDDNIDTPTAAQRMIFGAVRRRVPRMFDADQSLMLGALHDMPSRAVAAAGLRPFFAGHVPEIGKSARAAFAELSGRDVGPLRLHATKDAAQLIVAQGKLADVAIAAAERARTLHGERVGVVALRTLRPLPASTLAEALRGYSLVTVLERTDGPLSDTPPLVREIRDLLARARENSDRRQTLHLDVPALRGSDLPTVCSARIGLGGAPLRVADIVALCREQAREPRTSLNVGLPRIADIDVSRAPKREAMLQALLGGYPSLDTWTVSDGGSARATARMHGELNVVVVRGRGPDDDELAVEAARLLDVARPGRLRGRLAQRAAGHGDLLLDAFVSAPADGAGDAGEPLHGDVVLLERDLLEPQGLAAALAAVRPRGALLLAEGAARCAPAHVLRTLFDAVKVHSLHVHVYPRVLGDDDLVARERALGALLALAAPLVEAPTRKLGSAREKALALGDDDETSRQRRLAAFNAALAQPPAAFEAPPDADSEAGQGAAERRDEERVPWLVRRLGWASPGVAPIADLATFWGEVGVLYRRDETDALVVEPCVASGATPPLSAAMQVNRAAELPHFEPDRCVGCGLCWSCCPDAALAPLALDVDELLAAGLDQAGKRGADIGALRPLLGKVAARARKKLRSFDPVPVDAEQALRPAFDAILEKAGFDEARQQGLRGAFEAVIGAIGGLPVAACDGIFDSANDAVAGTLLSLAVDPDACKGCGLCSALCAEAIARDHAAREIVGEIVPALTMRPADAFEREGARAQHELWTTLPDATGARLAALRDGGAVDALGVLQLSRHSLLAYAGADDVEPGSGLKIALRAALSSVEVARQRLIAQRRDALTSLRDALGDRVRERLAGALPSGDISALAAGIEQLEGSNVTLSELSRRVEDVVDAGRIDVRSLERLVALSGELDKAIWRLGQGVHGLGRARLGVLLCPDALPAPLGVFPQSGFQAPVMVERAARAVPVARALAIGQARAALDVLSVARRAKLELDQPQRAELLGIQIPRVAIDELDADERADLPPLLVVAASSALDDGALAEALGSRTPIVLLLLCDGSVDRAGRPRDRSELELIALARGQAYVAQSSLAYSEHLVQTLARALAFDGPSVVQIYAPSPRAHGFAADATIARARDAVRTRVAPLVRYDPRREGVFGTQIELEGNPDVQAAWASDASGAALTPARFCAEERRFSGAAGEAAAEALARHAEARWRTLQELAGVLTPFTARVQDEARAAVGSQHSVELETLRRSHEQAIASLRDEHAIEVTARVREALMRLAGFGAPS
ncbi:MAG: hypothetical protein KC503_45345 [Myxococcales bacterium]|nr:hypothetical protein [Myxococcales bacterium]